MDFAEHCFLEAMRLHPPVPPCGFVTPGYAPRLKWAPLPRPADGVPLELTPL
jgi:hypothetical protein